MSDQVTCRHCCGSGKVKHDDFNPTQSNCPHCAGEGTITDLAEMVHDKRCPALLTIEQQRELCDMLLNSRPATQEEIDSVEISDEEFATMKARLLNKMSEMRALSQPSTPREDGTNAKKD